MLKNLIYLCIGLFFHLTNNAQVNLVPNPSFEDTIGDCTSIPFAFVSNVKEWYQAKESPDYFNVCTNATTYPSANTIPFNCHGSQLAHTNNAYSAIALYYLTNPLDSINISSELMGVKLKQSLKTNACYYGEFYMSLAEISDIGINTIGMLFTQNTYTLGYQIFDNLIQPQIKWNVTQCFTDTSNWVKVSGTFIAQGGEEYLTIGNFRDGMNLNKQFLSRNYINICNLGNPNSVSYVYIDDVALYELPSPHIQNTAITICPNADSLILGDTARIHTRYQWYANGVAIDTTSFIKVKPTQKTTYVLQTTQCAITTQSIVVTYSSNCEPVVVVEPIIPNVFTPNNDSINDVWRFNLGKGNVLKNIAIFNRWGNEMSVISRTSVTEIRWDGRTTSGEETPSGVYYYVLRYTDVNGEEHRKNGYVTLMR